MRANLDGGGHNEEIERLFAYHHATKHTYQSVRANARFLDWQNQPSPFRTYEGAPTIALEPDPGFPGKNTFATMAALDGNFSFGNFHQRAPASSIDLDGNLLSRLLWHSMAISAWKKVPGSGARYSLRVNPSSGNLHPTETYLALCGFTGFENGLYHYRVDRHALELRSRGDWAQRVTEALELPWASNSALIVGLTSIFWREAWKYGNRAYRYCCHDMGHATMSLLLAAQALGMSGGAIAHFSDLRAARVLGLAESDEAPMAFLIFHPKCPAEKIGVISDKHFLGIPNELSREEVPYSLLLGIHESSILPDPPGPLPHMVQAESPGPALNSQYDISLGKLPASDVPLGPIVRRRRSALDFDPSSSPLGREQLHQLLDFATRDWRADWRGNFDGGVTHAGRGVDFVTLFLYVHRVRDCEPGVYRWNRLNGSLEHLHRANVQRIAAFLSLEQSLAGNACFAMSMIGNLAEAARIFGNRGYRLIHFEAGAIGQRLYVGAEALGFNATGMGAFYDDDVHRYLGFLEEENASADSTFRRAVPAAFVTLDATASRRVGAEAPAALFSNSIQQRELHETRMPPADSRYLPKQVIYHFAVGRAIPDPRIDG